MSDELNEMVGDLLNQLQEANKKANTIEKEKDPLKKENLEKFVIEKAGELVEQSVSMVNNVKDYVFNSPESKDVSSLSELIAATATAIETLNKIIVTDKKNQTIKDIKQMDVDFKSKIKLEDNTSKFLATREQMLKMLLDNAKAANTDLIEIKAENQTASSLDSQVNKEL